jgi:hypothetical protein
MSTGFPFSERPVLFPERPSASLVRLSPFLNFFMFPLPLLPMLQSHTCLTGFLQVDSDSFLLFGLLPQLEGLVPHLKGFLP